jgi:hypothetical protein
VLGTAPTVLPEPLAGLVRELAATRQGHATIGRPDTAPWLFPGGHPGQPIGGDRLGILARMLGIHIQVAVQWQKAAAGDWMTYDADVSRRGPRSEIE